RIDRVVHQDQLGSPPEPSPVRKARADDARAADVGTREGVEVEYLEDIDANPAKSVLCDSQRPRTIPAPGRLETLPSGVEMDCARRPASTDVEMLEQTISDHEVVAASRCIQ